MNEGHGGRSADHVSLFRDDAMRRFRFHLGTLVIVVLLFGVGFAALRESNEAWDRCIFSMMLGVLLLSILLAIHRLGSLRAFWLGFALFGWIYVALTLVPPIESRLVTTKALAYLHSKMPAPYSGGLKDLDADGRSDLFVVNNSQPNSLYYVDKGNGTFEDVTPAAVKLSISNIFLGTSPAGSSGTTENFVRIGHSLVALVAGLLGGLLSRHLRANSRAPNSGPVNPKV